MSTKLILSIIYKRNETWEGKEQRGRGTEKKKRYGKFQVQLIWQWWIIPILSIAFFLFFGFGDWLIDWLLPFYSWLQAMYGLCRNYPEYINTDTVNLLLYSSFPLRAPSRHRNERVVTGWALPPCVPSGLVKRGCPTTAVLWSEISPVFCTESLLDEPAGFHCIDMSRILHYQIITHWPLYSSKALEIPSSPLSAESDTESFWLLLWSYDVF